MDSLYAKAFSFEEMGDYKNAYDTWITITETLRNDGYDIGAEKKQSEACFKKRNANKYVIIHNFELRIY